MSHQINQTNRICNLFFGITIFCTIISSTNIVSAQITPDNTLPNNSEVGIEGNITKIEGGTTAVNNLFHSFEKFGIPTGNEAHFNNAVDINNIITRVTGKSISDIDGLIKADGSANLFLINPNGIVFGENAKLDIGGSFVGSTADSFQFGNDVEFSAVNPGSKPLLSVNVPLGLQYGKNPGSIQVKGDGDTQRETPEIFEPKSGLQVPLDKTLAILGGDVLLEGATLKAGSGNIQLGSVTGEGLVSITPLKEGFDFGFDKVNNFGEIRLSQNTAVDASGNGAGNVRVTGKNVTLADSSVISSTQTGTEKSAGILVNATEIVDINGVNDTFISSGFYANSVSNNLAEETSNISINTQQLRVRNGATIATNTWGYGQAGNINIKASNFSVESGALVSAIASSSGNGGNIDIDSEQVQVIGVGNNNIPSVLSVSAKEKSTGNTGNLNIITNNLLAENGGFIFAGTSGKGNGGNMTINATSKIEVIGQGGIDNQFASGLLVVAEEPSTGDSGSLTINTKRMIVENGAFVSVSNNALGRAGDLKITSDDLLIQDNARFFVGRVSEGEGIGNSSIKTNRLLVAGGSTVEASTSGEGGNLNIDAHDVQVIGTSNNGNTPTSLVLSPSQGNKGSINLNAKQLLIKDGAFVSAGTSSVGDGGNLIINAEDVQVVGKGGNNSGNNNLPYSSGLFTATEKSSTGDAGKLIINAKRMLVQDEAYVSSASNGKKNGGDLIIDTVRLQVQNGSSVLSGTDNAGTGGDLKITANSLLVEDRARINAGTSGTGDAGNLTINSDIIQVRDKAQVSVESTGTGDAGILTLNSDSIRLNNDALLTANTRNNKIDSDTEQATINIKSQELIMRRGSNIFTNATGENVVGGNINIDTDFLIANENSDISANSENFRGGNVRIDALGVFGTQFRSQPTSQSDITATGATENSSGTVEVITPKSDINSGLVELPTIPVETEIANACSTPGYAQSSFTITGKGSLPPSPFEPLTGRLNRTKLATLDEVGETKVQGRRSRIKKEETKIKQIVEAKGWVRTKDGEIILVAHVPKGKYSSPASASKSCYERK